MENSEQSAELALRHLFVSGVGHGVQEVKEW